MRFMLKYTLVMTILINPREAEVPRFLYHCDGKAENNPDVHCFGKLEKIPRDLPRSLQKLSVSDADIRRINRNSLDLYRATLRDIILSKLPFLEIIEDGAFANISNLRTIYISHAPKLKILNGLLVGITSSNFYSLRIVFTGLEAIPDLFHLPSNNSMHLLDLDHNNIKRIKSNAIKVTAAQVTMNFNPTLEIIEDYAFNGSLIASLSMHSNHKLHQLNENAFKGLSSLRFLDLSHTSIKDLPIEGLQDLETLKIEKTPSLQTIPSIYDLRNLVEARLTHSFHCCAFRYPAQHNPEKHAQYEAKMKKICETSQNHVQGKVRKKRLAYEGHVRYSIYSARRSNSTHASKFSASSQDHEQLKPLTGKLVYKTGVKMVEPLDDSFDDGDSESDQGFFHKSAIDVNQHQTKFDCGPIIFQIPEVDCFPEPNALNPCEDIMGYSWLRISVWCVLILALVGNSAVIAVVASSDAEINASRFLISNLAFADLCMGLYLLLIASMDYHSVGSYFNFAYQWQYGVGCQIAGFLTVFSSHLSIFALTIVTLERWFAITYAIHLTKRITIKSSMYILLGGWLYSILIATLPILGASNYSSTSICLPMESDTMVDKVYLYWLIFINTSAFGLIVFCYVQIYMSLGYETRRASTKGEMTIAKKMAMLIFIDFATVAPVAFFGLTALTGYPLISVTRSKILLVFFYPLNACANPYLYALMTAQYRNDLLVLVSRCGICKKKAKLHKLSDALPTNTILLTRLSHSYSNGERCVTRSCDV